VRGLQDLWLLLKLWLFNLAGFYFAQKGGMRNALFNLISKGDNGVGHAFSNLIPKESSCYMSSLAEMSSGENNSL
jgi:hypothetical protein